MALFSAEFRNGQCSVEERNLLTLPFQIVQVRQAKQGIKKRNGNETRGNEEENSKDQSIVKLRNRKEKNGKGERRNKRKGKKWKIKERSVMKKKKRKG